MNGWCVGLPWLLAHQYYQYNKVCVIIIIHSHCSQILEQVFSIICSLFSQTFCLLLLSAVSVLRCSACVLFYAASVLRLSVLFIIICRLCSQILGLCDLLIYAASVLRFSVLLFTYVNGSFSFANGSFTDANGSFSFANGSFTDANGSFSFANGSFTDANALI